MQSTIQTKNQFGEQANQAIIGGSSQLFCSFKVDSANANGLGISGLSSSGKFKADIANVFSHTSQTPATGNPNPAAGNFLIEFLKPYAGFISLAAVLQSPLSGTPVTTTVNHTMYVISALGTTTLLQWQAVGLPVGVTPAVGVAFVATASQAIGGTGAVQVPATTASNVDHFEATGSPALTLSAVGGGYLAVASYKADALTAPTDGTIVTLVFDLLAAPASQI